MTCKDCIHNEMCYGTHTDDSPTCCDFKDKSRYIELPCKVGDTVYLIHGDKVRQAVILAFYIDKVGIICELKISMNGANPTAPCCAAIIDKDTYTDNDIYLTSEEAEKALKERERE